jgi:hypothetical protein
MKAPALGSYTPVCLTKSDPIVLVGVCASGKSTVAQLLQRQGLLARAVAQEHSRVPWLYAHLGPGWIVCLCANWETVHRRRPLAFAPDFYEREWLRIREARASAHLIIHTDYLTAPEVTDLIISWWPQRVLATEHKSQAEPASKPLRNDMPESVPPQIPSPKR